MTRFWEYCFPNIHASILNYETLILNVVCMHEKVEAASRRTRFPLFCEWHSPTGGKIEGKSEFCSK